MEMPDALKKELRREIKARLSLMSEEQRANESASICRQIVSALQKLDHGRMDESSPLKVAIFAATPEEVNLMPLLHMGINAEWFFPRCAGPHELFFHHVTSAQRDLTSGCMGLKEPRESLPIADPAELDVIVTPGLAFTVQGARMGKGRGYYDAYLKRAVKSVKIGVCFSCQIVGDVPMDKHDEFVDILISAR